eukprot:CAMPEP_0177681416 /NCGR_PEP_ID=MMETSP0447-20121125/30707_1 /TAXON_ID=0 /ORGANISM="Stygamoeba regulata, Strain BSH-02190019" /LENGTH=705 /DNA_ID=CAMNT_0019190837 /DNA_START=67 /DNA_END=2184 /DNA_ORIENTATION=+
MADTQKDTLSDTERAELKTLFLALSLTPKIVENSLKNATLSRQLAAFCAHAKLSACERSRGQLLYDLAVSAQRDSLSDAQRLFVVDYVCDDRINSQAQFKAALTHLTSKLPASAFSPAPSAAQVAAFETACGVGVVVSAKDVSAAVQAAIKKNEAALRKERYHFQSGRLVGQVSKQLKWAAGDDVRAEVTAQIEALLGPKTAEDLTPTKPSGKGKDSSATKEKPSKKKALIVLKAPDASQYPLIKIQDTKDFVGKKIQLKGWIAQIRGSARVKFCQLRDGTGWLQMVFAGEMVQSVDINELMQEASVHVFGTLVQPPPGKEAKWTPRYGFELNVEHWELIGKSDSSIAGRLVFKEYEKEEEEAAAASTSSNSAVVAITSGQKVLFDLRYLVHRQHTPSIYLRLRSAVTQCFREHYFAKGYTEITPPTLVQCQAEGGSELFSFDFFGEPAYLTQSSQLYLETVIPAVGDCFCLASSYRAEKSRTRRHLAEYSHLEAEMPFITFEDLLECLEDLFCDVVDRVLKSPAGELLREINPNVAVPQRPFVRMEYVDAIEFCRKNLIYKDEDTKEFFEFGDDIPEMPERKMTDMIGRPIFLCRFPVEMKAFYMPKAKDDPRLTESVDLLVPGVGEVIGGSMRISDFTELMAAYEREGIDPGPYEWFTDQRKYGSVPHGGYGLGMERFLVWLFGDDHIKNVCLYPRYRGRCTP